MTVGAGLLPVRLRPPLSAAAGPWLPWLARCAVVAALGATSFASADDLTGAELAWKYHCTTCHGERGLANSAQYYGEPRPLLASQ